VQFIANTYSLRLRADRLRDRGLLNKKELADKLGIQAATLGRARHHQGPRGQRPRVAI